MQITVTTKKTTTSVIEIPVPSFYKSTDYNNKLLAIIDESDIIRIWNSDSFNNIDSGSIEAAYLRDEAVKAFETWEPISRDEFERALVSTIAKFSLPKPELFVSDFNRED